MYKNFDDYYSEEEVNAAMLESNTNVFDEYLTAELQNMAVSFQGKSIAVDIERIIAHRNWEQIA